LTITEQPVSTPPAPGPVAPDDRMTAGQWGRLAGLLALFTLLTITTGIWGLVVVLGIVLMVFLHELGHYVAAKRAGMKVTEFFIGFGPRIWSFRRGETEYGLKAVPAGAYVKIIGMSSLEEVAPEDEAKSYRQGRFRDRFMVVTAGPLMNLASALVLIFIMLTVLGAPNGSLTKQPDQTKWKIDKIYEGTGAAAAGLKAGDKITAISGKPVATREDVADLIAGKQGQTLPVTYVRAGESHTVPVALKPYKTEDGYQACCLGISQKLTDIKTEKVNPIVAVPRSFQELGVIAGKSLGALGSFFTPSGLGNFADQVVNARTDRQNATTAASTVPNTKAPTSATGSGSAEPGQDRLISMIGVFHIGTSAAASGVFALLFLFVLLNISLGLLNLVPLLPFDGGHAAIAVYEKVQERRRHLTGRYFTDVSRLMPVVYFVVIVLVGIFITTTYLDITNPLRVD